MNQRPFGRTGARVSEIGLGCWQLGGSDWGDVSDAAAHTILQTAVDAGTNMLDTADVYGSGRSEELIGSFLKTQSEPIYVATKLGRGSDPGWPENFTDAAIRKHTEASLRRLGVEALDLTQLHCIPTEELRKGQVFDSLRTLKSEGKIKDFGASVESMEEALICLDQPELASLQIIFNIFRQKPIDVLFERAKAQGVAIIVRLPLASGLLSGKMKQGTQFAENDHRKYNRDGQAFNVGETFAGLPYELGVTLSDDLKAYVPDGETMAQWALRWILDFDAVSVVIPGASRPEQAAANADASKLPPLGADAHAKLREFYATRVAEHIRGPY
jgi:aryl-alcohol dehydrogenase-like predicted oxidoreductase